MKYLLLFSLMSFSAFSGELISFKQCDNVPAQEEEQCLAEVSSSMVDNIVYFTKKKDGTPIDQDLRVEVYADYNENIGRQYIVKKDSVLNLKQFKGEVYIKIHGRNYIRSGHINLSETATEYEVDLKRRKAFFVGLPRLGNVNQDTNFNL